MTTLARWRDHLHWWAYRSPWARLIGWLGYVVTYGETPARTVCRWRELAESLDTVGLHEQATCLRVLAARMEES